MPALFKTGKRAHGSFGFELSGVDGGAWSVDLAAGRVAKGKAMGSLVVKMSSEDFASLLAGKLDVAAAMEMGRFTYAGDAELFFTLAKFLNP